MKKEAVIDWQVGSHLSDSCSEPRQGLNVCLRVYCFTSWQEKGQQNFTRLGYMLSIEGGTLLLRETVTMLRSRDEIHWGPISF